MLLKFKRFTLTYIFIILFTALGAQTLYWVGGSGNFNDPKHWSLSSGGEPANKFPDVNTEVIFNDNSGPETFYVRFTGQNKLGALRVQLVSDRISFIGEELTELQVAGDFILNEKSIPEFKTKLVFNPHVGSQNKSFVNFYNHKLHSNVDFISGSWDLRNFSIDEERTVKFLSGTFYIDHSRFKVGNFVSNSGKTKFIITGSLIHVDNKFVIGSATTFETKSAFLEVDLEDKTNFLVDPSVNFGSSAKLIGNGNPVAACGVTLTSQGVSCAGNTDGKLFGNIDATCTNGPFSLIWNNPGGACTNVTLTNVGVGTFTINNMAACALQYDVLVVDASNNPVAASNQVNIPGPGLISLNIFSTIMPSCFGNCNGQINANLNGGTPNYTIQLTPPIGPVQTLTNQTSGIKTFTGLCAGVQSFSITDANGCSRTFTSNVNQPSTLTATPLVTNITCNGFSNGVFAVSPLGGTPAYTVNFSLGAPQSTGTLGTVSSSGLPAGPISATVTDAKGCLAVVNGTITEPTALTATPSHTDVLCNGANTGAASVLASGGTPPYAYSWSPTAGASSVIINLVAGTQTVTVTDFNLCTTTANYTILQPGPIVLTPNPTHILCAGSCTGIAAVNASGGNGAFTYTWVAPGPFTISTGAASSVVNQCSGNYTVFAKDANLCTSSVVVTITQTPTFTISTISQSISCFGAADGAATVNVSGGNGGPYTFTWSPGGSNAQSISGLGPNTYSVTVFDQSSCPAFTTASIIQPTAGLAPLFSASNLSCNIANAPCNGVITVTPNGGTAPYSYTLSTGGSTIFSAPPYNSLCAGVYNLNVKDASGCSQSTVMTLTQPGVLSGVANITAPISCFGSSVGGLTGSPSGGTPTYTLTWTTPSGTVTGAVITNQPAGNYTLIVTDSHSCTAQATATLTQPPAIIVTTSSANISCFSGCNGVLNSTVSGGTPGYSFAWTNSLSANVGTNSSANSLCPGNYTLTVTDNNLCAKTSTTFVSSPPPIVLSQTTIPVACFGNSNGSATVVAVGGTTPYVNYNFVSASSTVTNLSGIITAQPAGNYTATVTDFAGCTQSTTFTITAPPLLTANVSGTVGSCNICNGFATVTAVGGNVGAYTYSWTNTASTSSAVSSLCPGNFTVTVTDTKACVATATSNIAFVVNVTVTPVGAGGILCNGLSTGSANATHVGGTGPFTYSWVAAGAPTLNTQAVSTLSGGIVYTVTVKDASLCSNSATIQLTQPTSMTVSATKTNVACFSFTNGAINVSISGGTPVYTQTWSPGGQLTPNISGLGAGSYTLNIRDANLCPSSTVVTITQPPSITISLVVTNPAGCIPALANGSICATASGGSGSGYQYTITPGAITNTTGCFTGLGGGTYSISVSDGSGCSNITFTTLSTPFGPTVTVSSTSVACFGFSTAVASATASGANPFTFSWAPAVPNVTTSTTTSASNLPAGLYIITATDNNGCVASQSVNITQPSSVTINSSFNNLSCNSISTGSISVGPSGGTPGSPSYTFAWLPAASITTGQGTATVTGLAAGNYTLNLTDGNSCLTQYNFTLTQPPAITITAITSSLLCNSICNGSIVANATGGTGVINYSWTPIGGNTATVTNLCANTGTNPVAYTLTVKDGNLCTKTDTYVIAEPTALTSTVTLVSASCSNSCNAVASHSANGGTPAYTFSWSSSAATTSTLGALCAGNYTATTTDAHGCTSIKPFTVSPVTPISVTLTPTNPLCNASCNGSITTLVAGAQGTVAYSWLPAGTGQNPSGLCATPNPNYTLVATDQNSCQVTSVITLTNPPALIASVTATNPICHDDLNGSAVASVTNAIGATSYSWLPTLPLQTGPTATALASGVYTVQVSDNNNCQATHIFTLSNPPSFTINTSISPATCSQSNGAITANPSGGTPGAPTAYTYTWTGVVSSSSVVTNLFAGIYTVQIADGVGCNTTVIIPLSNANGPNSAPIISSSIICNAQCTGAASVNIGGISGGTAPYLASWIAPAPSTVNPLSNLCAGSYTARITDALACILFTSVVIAEPPPIVISPSLGLPVCPGVCSGSISLNTSGGNSPYSYTWSPAQPNSATLTNLCAGDYTVIIGYNGICSQTSTLSLPDQSSITIVPTVTNNTCFGNCNAVASISVSGGTSPYNASWSNSQNGFLINNLCNGSYTVSVTDNNGCLSTSVASITSGAQITSSTAIVSPSCGLCNGTASVTASGGTSPFTFNWSTSATTASISNVCAGIYQVVITDAQACTQSQTVIVNNSNGITGESFNLQQIPCSGACSGAATVIPVGGNPPISFNWLNPVSSTSVISNLCGGVYFVQMTDAQNCIRSASVTLNPLVSLTVTPLIIQPTCGSNNGSISVAVSGGSSPYTYTWSPVVNNTSSLTSIGAGTYSLMVTESSTNNCSVPLSFNMSNANGPVITATVINNNCFGGSSASVIALGTGVGAITYSWSNSTTSPTVTGLQAGVVTLTVTSTSTASICKTIQSFTLVDNPALVLSASNIQHPTCFGDCDGAITLIPSGGVLPYTFAWTPTGTVNPLVNLCDGTYSATVIDAKGCPVSSPQFTIVSQSSMSLTSTTFSSSCSSLANGSITVIPNGGVPSYTFAWQGPTGFTATTQNISNLLAGSYTLVVTDNLGCQKSDTLDVVPTITVIARAGANATICPITGTIVIDGTPSSGAVNYKWYMLPDMSTTIASTPDYTVQNIINPANYMLVATSSVAGCFDSDTVFIDLFPTPLVSAGTSTSIPVFTTFTIGGHPTGPTAVSYTWIPPFYLDKPNDPNPIASNTTNVTYTVTVMDEKGCIASDTMQLLVLPEVRFSNAFSPNSDGKNDTWIIDYIEQFPNSTIEIYNRWGELLFTRTGIDYINNPFDGKHNGKDLPVGTYYYIINLVHPIQEYTRQYTGPLTIFR